MVVLGALLHAMPLRDAETSYTSYNPPIPVYRPPAANPILAAT